jgi:glycosyltransferase involved in cell wall biosynthesis
MKESALVRILHVIPLDGIGGVELAAHAAAMYRPEVELLFVDDAPQTPGLNGKVGGVRGLLRSARQVLGVDVFWRPRASKVDFAVFSLWKTALILVVWRLLRRSPAIFFVHSSKPAHRVDEVLTRLALTVADGILCDSVETRDRRVPARLRKGAHVVSLLTEPVPPESDPARRSPHEFIFWGRLAPEKRLDRVISVFQKIHSQEPRARLSIIGPDAGELERCRNLIAGGGLTDVISVIGPLGRDAIFDRAARATFFLQLSDFEGFCKSAVEAMQHGLVPAVTPVGDVGRYCVHLTNSVHMLTEKQFIADICRVMSSADETRLLSTNARLTWVNRPLYPDDFVQKVQLAVCGNT